MTRKDNSIKGHFEVKRLERRSKIKARQRRTNRYREKVNSIVRIIIKVKR